MTKYVSLAILFLAANFAAAQDHGFGAGVLLGEPMGLSVKQWLTQQSAIDGALGYSFPGDEHLELHGDYLFHIFKLFPYPFDEAPLYFGGGARFKFNDDVRFGIRAPVGISYFIRNIPVDLFAEFAPVLDLAPSVRLDFTGGVGVRYWF